MRPANLLVLVLDDGRYSITGGQNVVGAAATAAVVGALMWALLMQLLGVLPGTESIRPYLLGTQFDAWHGFLRTPADWAPVIRAVWLCALYIGLPLIGAYLVFLRRDVAGE